MQFTKSSKLDNVLYDVRGPVVDEAIRMEEQCLHVLKLNIGNPAAFDFRAPDEVVTDMRAMIADCEGYSDSKGIVPARKAIMQYAQLKGIPNVGMKDVYTGNGSSELIQLALHALLDTGDEVLIPAPDYPLWTACTNLAGGKAVHYVCDEESDWLPDVADMESKVTDRTKAIVVINPNNPTGALYPREVLEDIVEVARRHGLMIMADEIYDRLVMDGEEHVSIASLAPDLFCVTFNGLSKSHMVCGFRVGWMIFSGNKDLGKDYIDGVNMLSNMRLCSNVPGQSIVQTALGGYQSVKEYVVPGGRIFEQREAVFNALKDIPGITVKKPKAAFYMFPKLDTKRFNITDDNRFALDFLREKRVLVVPGRGFNWMKPDHFRIVYLPRLSVLKEAMAKLGDFLSSYRQD
ncbi:MAG: aminotransferase class I/II-fold pyridoxal phosphate-dependent enzyme [Desulfovibrio sp.]|jgi:alanine-synthesizing transaminase|nr:aminotransferase class I/II-fold pyridoxal phosphate-dependent enzyme [Clostridia bacterium]